MQKAMATAEQVVALSERVAAQNETVLARESKADQRVLLVSTVLLVAVLIALALFLLNR